MDPASFLTTPMGVLAILAIAALVHEPWRWLGLYIGNALPAGSVIFDVVRSMATALVAGLVVRLILFPAGALADISVFVRVLAFTTGVGLFALSGRHLGVGVFGAAFVLVAGQLLTQ